MTAKKTVSSSVDRDSGIRWKKAPPKRAPEAKLTNTRRALLRKLVLIARRNAPTRETALTRSVEAKIQTSVSIPCPH